jgi:hypothetical protein
MDNKQSVIIVEAYHCSYKILSKITLLGLALNVHEVIGDRQRRLRRNRLPNQILCINHILQIKMGRGLR